MNPKIAAESASTLGLCRGFRKRRTRPSDIADRNFLFSPSNVPHLPVSEAGPGTIDNRPIPSPSSESRSMKNPRFEVRGFGVSVGARSVARVVDLVSFFF